MLTPSAVGNLFGQKRSFKKVFDEMPKPSDDVESSSEEEGEGESGTYHSYLNRSHETTEHVQQPEHDAESEIQPHNDEIQPHNDEGAGEVNGVDHAAEN